MKIYRTEFKVPSEAIDALVHVNNLEYMRWMLDASFKHSDEVGCTEATQAIGAGWVVRSHKIEYLRPAFEGETMVVVTWVTNFRKVRSVRKYLVFRAEDEVLLTRGETDWVFIDMQTGKPKSVPESIVRMFELIPEGEEPTSFKDIKDIVT